MVEYREENGTTQIDPADFKLLDLRIKLSDKEFILAKGRVVRARRAQGQLYLGIEFSEISEEDRNKAKELLASGSFKGIMR